MRLVGSSQANLFASIASGIAALWEPLHGGANQAVLEMLMRIHNDGGNIDKYVDMAKDKDSGFRLMGLGTGFIKISTRVRDHQKLDQILEKLDFMIHCWT